MFFGIRNILRIGSPREVCAILKHVVLVVFLFSRQAAVTYGKRPASIVIAALQIEDPPVSQRCYLQ